MRSCHKLVEVMLHSTSLAEQQEAAVALSVLPITPKAWHTAVRALPALVDLVQQPSCTAEVRDQVLRALDRVKDSARPIEEVTAGVIRSIVQLLGHHAGWAQCAAAGVLMELSENPSCQAKMVAAGAFGRLVHLLKPSVSSCDLLAVVRSTVAAALAHISSNAVRGAECIFAAGAVPPLVQLLSPDSGETAQDLASICSSVLVVLGNIAGQVAASHAALLDAGAAPRLVKLLQSLSCEDTKEKAASFLANLASGGPESQARIAAAGAIGSLVMLLASSSDVVQNSATSALGNLAFNVDVQGTIAAAGAVAPLARLLQSKSATTQEQAARILIRLNLRNDAKDTDIAAACGIPTLVRLLRSDSTTVQMLAVTVLTSYHSG